MLNSSAGCNLRKKKKDKTIPRILRESLKAAFPDRQQAAWVDFSARLLYAVPR
jgi:hypothetical protein